MKNLLLPIVSIFIFSSAALAFTPDNPALNCSLGVYALCGADCQDYESCLRNPPSNGCSSEREDLCDCLQSNNEDFDCGDIPNHPRKNSLSADLNDDGYYQEVAGY